MIDLPRDAWRVFDQSEAPRLRVSDWRRNATRFFAIDFAVVESTESAVRLTIDGAPRVVVGRAREEVDLRDALTAENAAGNGLYDLAERRCRTVWLVERAGSDDPVALRLAAVLASVGLGPILGTVSARWELFGVRTAREKLDKLAAQ